MKLVTNTLLVLLLTLIVGCATLYTPVPDGYIGAVAQVEDTFDNKRSSIAHFYELAKVNGQNIERSWGATRGRNYGRGFHFEPVMITRKLPTIPLEVTLEAYRFFSTDGQGMFSDNYSLQHTFSFTPKASELYRVKGDVSVGRTSVWLEDSNGNRVEKSYISLDPAGRDAKNKAESAKRKKERKARKKTKG